MTDTHRFAYRRSIVQSVLAGTLIFLLSVGCLAQQPVPPSKAKGSITSIRAVDFRNFDYPADCESDDFPKIIHVTNGGWGKTLQDGSIIGFSLAKPVFGLITGRAWRDADPWWATASPEKG